MVPKRHLTDRVSTVIESVVLANVVRTFIEYFSDEYIVGIFRMQAKWTRVIEAVRSTRRVAAMKPVSGVYFLVGA